MSSTRTKPFYIQPTKEGYANLGEEILDLHSHITQQDTNVEEVKSNIEVVKQDLEIVKSSTSELNSDLAAELTTARGSYDSINDRLLAMDSYEVLKIVEKLTTTRDYEYDADGYIVKEKIRGDLNYDIIYEYDSSRNIIKETRQSIDGTVIGTKSFRYNALGMVDKISGTNTDDVMTVTNSMLMNELSARLSQLEAIDFVQFAEDLKTSNVGNLWEVIQGLLTRVQTLELVLPENITQIIDIPNIVARIDGIEDKLNQNYVIYTFDVKSSQTEYDVPSTINPDKTAVYLEGLLLEYNVDYTIANGKMKFLIPLIDDFTVTCRY